MALNLCQFQNIHKDKLGFIIGSGPSLKDVKPEVLSPYVTMTVNSSILFDKSCDYFVSDDWSVSNWSYFIRDLAHSSCIKFLYNKKFQGRSYHLRQHEICMFDHTWYFDPKTKKYNMKGLVMTKECNAPVIGARTSLASGIHIMRMMGCNPIVMLGCDCRMMGDKRYFWEYPGFTKPVRLDKRSVMPSNVKIAIGSKECQDILEYWKLFKKMNENCDTKIINATQGSALNIFEQDHLDKILEKYSDRKK